jgi:hypothetical protein
MELAPLEKATEVVKVPSAKRQVEVVVIGRDCDN